MRRSDAKPGAAQAIAHGRKSARGVLVQTTHWRHNVLVGVWVSWVFAALFAGVLSATASETAPSGAGPSGEVARTVLGLLLLAWPLILMRLVLTRVGLEVGPRGYVARRALRRPVPVSAHLPLSCGAAGVFGRMYDDGRSTDLYGLLAAQDGDRVAVPGLQALTNEHLFYRSCRLVTRPIRPWYRLRARKSVHDDVIWQPDDADGVAVQLALGLMRPADVPEQEPEPDRFDTKVMRSTGRVRMSSEQVGRGASRLVEAQELTVWVAVLVAAAVIDYSAGLMVLTIFGAVIASWMPLIFLAVRSVTVASGEFRVVNGWARRQRLPLQEIGAVIVVPRGRHWAELRLDTDAGSVALKALRFRRLDARQDGARRIQWRCSPYGGDLRRVETPEDAALLLEAVMRSRGWRPGEDQAAEPPPPAPAEHQAAARLERWNRDAA